MAFDEKSTLKQISENEEAKAILEEYLPGMWGNPQTKMAYNFKLKAFAAFPQAGISKDQLNEIVEKLAKIQ
jgi:oligoendopeptidase F